MGTILRFLVTIFATLFDRNHVSIFKFNEPNEVIFQIPKKLE